MTYFKSTLIASVAAMSFIASPALAGEKMHKDHTAKTHAAATHDAAASLTTTERAAWETKVKSSMSAEKQAKWATYSDEKRQMWMNKKINKMMKAEAMGSMKPMPTSAAYQNEASSLSNNKVGQILQADGDMNSETDRKLLMSNGDQMTKAKLITQDSDNRASNNAIVVPTVGSNVLTTVSCPVGTTAQADMTCLVTGNYMPSS